MKRFFAAMLCCCIVPAVFAFAQGMDEGFEMARVVAFDHVAANAQHMENSDGYKMSMRLGDTVYSCVGSAACLDIYRLEHQQGVSRKAGKQ